ncbi:hypothetical protein FQN57_000529 [Myotisia sp. PD_48]|nr:hypothetical protein FQN57_000529 [Myotisia sp. PD_48]
MSQNTTLLPNGHQLSITPVFGGFMFKAHQLSGGKGMLPPGWTIVINTARPKDKVNTQERPPGPLEGTKGIQSKPRSRSESPRRQSTIDMDSFPAKMPARFTKPTANRDSLFISSIVFPPSTEFKPFNSPTRQIALMLWSTLYWYFHQAEPTTGDWRIHIRREGILKGRNLLAKLERMGLVATENSSVGLLGPDCDSPSAWTDMFVSRRSFWQIDSRIFLFTLQPLYTPAGRSPTQSGANSPSLEGPIGDSSSSSRPESMELPYRPSSGPYASRSSLPTYFPPPPTQYIITDGVHHPVRQKPPRQGEVFYIRHVPSVGRVLSFRIPIIAVKNPSLNLDTVDVTFNHTKNFSLTPTAKTEQYGVNASVHIGSDSDLAKLHEWMNEPGVDAVWEAAGSVLSQEAFLQNRLLSRHSFPVMGCWDDEPFGYFEVYWVKEDGLTKCCTAHMDDYDRGIRCLIGDETDRTRNRVRVWLSAMVHFCWLADSRTQSVVVEPPLDEEG